MKNEEFLKGQCILGDGHSVQISEPALKDKSMRVEIARELHLVKNPRP